MQAEKPCPPTVLALLLLLLRHAIDMRYVTGALRWFLFLVFFLFALKNHELVSLKFYFDLEWKVPLVLLLFMFFVAGALAGLLSLLPRVLRQRREVAEANAQLAQLHQSSAPKRAEPPRDAVAPES